MDQEEAITGIRKINISLAEREFKAKPIYAYDVFISEKEYAEMLANEKKSLRNWAYQIWYYILYFARLAYKSVSVALSIIFVILFFSFITNDPVKAMSLDELILLIRSLTPLISVFACVILLLSNPSLRYPKNIFMIEVLKKLYGKAQENNNC
ncbi:MAG: hypothetical protein KH127_00270 [Haemophilus parainfluenzae]|nr:hypothetical protein [Haemophilus parainfluenzae]